ncbi:MAG: prepilin-type N-terminal cleavage/methylation domain-containing protein [Chthoniobacteraceae bacterium]|nr:prepilin-type N-terminal cleavage/methylation domain-containing protein [Chthoniobacteraceae bacterium]
MLQNINKRRGGFTLVEIMIVVAIIALLATFAVPSFMRARLRTQATACKEDLRQIDQAIDQWAMENNKKKGDTPTGTDLAAYIKENSTLYTALKASPIVDTLGSTINIPALGSPLQVPKATADATVTVTGSDGTFWAPFTTGT